MDVRVSTIPSGHGERVVLRLLDKQAGRLDLESLGMDSQTRDLVDELIHKPHGILLVTGPTGSGKTTTLYAALERLNDNSRNIMTVEDPIEYYIDGIGQTQVNTKVEMTFARGLRAILRQDPDVVMVGEIRDLETAQIAVQASLTGHLVLSTLHTNTAVGAITRLRDMGIEPFLLSSSLIGVVAQRLVRVLNPDSRQATPASEYERRLLNVPRGESSPTLYRPGRDAGNGYRGRTGIYELALIDDQLRTMIHDGSTEQELERYARTLTPSIRDDGRSKSPRGRDNDRGSPARYARGLGPQEQWARSNTRRWIPAASSTAASSRATPRDTCARCCANERLLPVTVTEVAEQEVATAEPRYGGFIWAAGVSTARSVAADAAAGNAVTRRPATGRSPAGGVAADREAACAEHSARRARQGAWRVTHWRPGFGDFPRVFPEIYRATVAAGEQSGHLDAVLERLADYTESREQIRQKVMGALLYPIVLTVMCFAIVSILLTYVVPKVGGCVRQQSRANCRSRRGCWWAQRLPAPLRAVAARSR